jgi:LacI family transcriptional regulator
MFIPSKPTSQDVARLAGVSQSAVSSILNHSEKISFSEETRERVVKAAHTLGYQLPRRKKNAKRQTGLVLVIVPTLANPFYAELGRLIESYADKHSIKAIVCSTFRKKELEKYYLELFVKSGIDGIIYTFLPSFQLLAQRIDQNTPVVLLGEKQDDCTICSIELSNSKSALIMGEHLYGLGHRRFIFVSTPFSRTTLARKQRLVGMQQLLKNHGLGKDALKVVAPPDSSTEYETDNSLQPYEYLIGRALTLQVLSGGVSATAFMGVNDMTAIGVAAALKENEYRIPDDFSVCGFDNIFSASVTSPALTTIDYQMNTRCKAAVDIILARNTAGEAATISYASKIEYLPQLIVRNSTGPPKR